MTHHHPPEACVASSAQRHDLNLLPSGGPDERVDDSIERRGAVVRSDVDQWCALRRAAPSKSVGLVHYRRIGVGEVSEVDCGSDEGQP